MEKKFYFLKKPPPHRKQVEKSVGNYTGEMWEKNKENFFHKIDHTLIHNGSTY